MDDMIVGQDKAFGTDDETGARAKVRFYPDDGILDE
jgi:hypothetical protein